jgi:hypothetical protein
MYTVWHVEKYKIIFNLVVSHWTNEILVTDIRNTGVLGLRFSTHSEILLFSEYFHYKIFIHENCLEN